MTYGYARAIAGLAERGGPAAVGTRKRGRLDACHSYKMTRPYRMPYTPDSVVPSVAA